MLASRTCRWLAPLVFLAGAVGEEPTFRSSAEFVLVDVQVLSGDQPVTDLKAEDFFLWDNNEAQEISNFGRDDRELDIILLLDGSGSTSQIHDNILQSAAQAMSHLYFRDRVGVAIFNLQPYLVVPPTWDRMDVLKKLAELPLPDGGTEVNTTISATARYLKQQARPGTRRVIVALTDNIAHKSSSDQRVRDDLWEADIVLNAVLFKTGYRGGNADVRKFVQATGGEVVTFRPGNLPLVELFERIRKRYVVLYRSPSSPPGSVRNIRVELAPKPERGLRT